MRNPVGNDLDCCEPFSVADGLITRLPVANDAGQFQGFGDPATVVFTIQFNGQFHSSIIAPGGRLRSRGSEIGSGSPVAYSGAEVSPKMREAGEKSAY